MKRARRLPSARSAAGGTLMLAPGGLVVYLGFNDGGFFPATQALVALILALLSVANVALDRGSIFRRNRPLTIVSLLFAAYSAWLLLSLAWSHAPLRAVGELDLTLIYVGVLVLCGSSVTSRRRLRWLVRGLAAGAFAVCLAALASRTLPNLLVIPNDLDTQRLSYPVTYWNALGLLAAIGTILCLGLSSDDREHGFFKGLAAAAIPVFAATLLLTFSRGALFAGIAGVAGYLVLTRSRSVFSALLSIVPAAAVAVHAAYQATALAQRSLQNPDAVSQGRQVAIVVGACALAAACARWLLIVLDRRLFAITWRGPLSRRARGLGGVLAVVLAGVVAVAAGLPHFVSREYDGFVTDNPSGGGTQVRDRLTQTGGSGRILLWRVAVDQFDSAPLHGSGAGTYPLAWQAHRPVYGQVVNAHNLYLENLSNLGIVGLGLLAGVLILSMVRLVLALRGPDRALWAAGLGVGLTWAIHAAVDWDWQLPVVSLPIFALAGAAFASGRAQPAVPVRGEGSSEAPAGETGRPRSEPPAGGRRRGLRAAAVLGLAIVPAVTLDSQSHIDASRIAFQQNDCVKATSEAKTSMRVLSFRPDAHEIVGYCEAAAGDRSAALRDVRQAVSEDPNDWETHEGLSVIQGALGLDPRAEMAKALALNPLNLRLPTYVRYFSYALRPYWVQEAGLDLLQVDGQNDNRNLNELRAGLRSR